MIKTDESFLAKLDFAIKQKGTNTRKVALDAGIDASVIRKWFNKERVANPTMKNIEKIANALNVRPADILPDEWNSEKVEIKKNNVSEIQSFINSLTEIVHDHPSIDIKLLHNYTSMVLEKYCDGEPFPKFEVILRDIEMLDRVSKDK